MRIDPEQQSIWNIIKDDGYAIFDNEDEASAHGVIEDRGIDHNNGNTRVLCLVKEYVVGGKVSARERASATVKKWSNETGCLSSDGTYYRKLVDAVANALREHEKDILQS